MYIYPIEMADIYNDKTYLRNNPSWGEEDASMKSEAISMLLKKNGIAFNTVAEAGCGSGEILVQLQHLFPQAEKFFGYDISRDAISIAIKKQTNQIIFENGDITAAKLYVDLMLVIDVIEHIPDYFGFLDGIRDKSAYTVFHIPLDMSVWSLFREKMLIESKERVGHIHHFTEEFTLQMLTDQGFTIIDKMYTPPTYTHTSIKQKITHGIRSMLFMVSKKFASKTIGGYSLMVLAKNRA